MSLNVRINCGSTEGLADLLRLLVVDTDCNEYLDCDNKDESIESIIKRLVSETDDGLLALNVCGCPEAPDVINTYQSVYVPWMMMKNVSTGAEVILNVFDECSEGGFTTPNIGIDLKTSTPVSFSVILPREITSGNISITPIVHYAAVSSYEADSLVMKLDMVSHKIGAVMDTFQTAQFICTDFTACFHSISVGDPVLFTGLEPQDIIHCLLDFDATNAYGDQVAIMGIELVFEQNGEIGSDSILV